MLVCGRWKEDAVVVATTTLSLELAVRRRLRRGACGHERRAAPDGVERRDEASVEYGQSAERHDIHDRVVEHVAVDDLIQLAVAEDHRLTSHQVRRRLAHSRVNNSSVDTRARINHLQQQVLVQCSYA